MSVIDWCSFVIEVERNSTHGMSNQRPSAEQNETQTFGPDFWFLRTMPYCAMKNCPLLALRGNFYLV